jgi:hypothetical protein
MQKKEGSVQTILWQFYLFYSAIEPRELRPNRSFEYRIWNHEVPVGRRRSNVRSKTEAANS